MPVLSIYTSEEIAGGTSASEGQGQLEISSIVLASVGGRDMNITEVVRSQGKMVCRCVR